MKSLVLFYLLFFNVSLSGQSLDFFRQIPDYPDSYQANTVAIRMIDGLGYRYYWATEGLVDNNLNYRVSPDSRTLRETLEHLYNLALVTESTTENKLIDRSISAEGKSLAELRQLTLACLERSRQNLVDQTELDSLNIRFGPDAELPFWNLVNGPIADALWHTGQAVMMRRAAANPLPKGVNVLTGKTADN